jgi:(1->4)-alpha-D-glucan 1-alpha-D-glucosylmutase
MASPIPTATYRLQFHGAFTFDAAAAITDYLAAVGVSHCYASSYLKAVPGSLHGYDVTDPTALNPEIGDDASHGRWVAALRAHGMGHILDFVPNHMGIAKGANAWWQDVLENGPSARSAPVFDIDWKPLTPQLANKVLLPILGDAYGAVLERQEIRLEYDAGTFRARYADYPLPIAPGTYDRLLGPDAPALLGAIGEDSEEGVEFLSILSAIRHLPSRQVEDADLLAERHREKEVIKKRLAALSARSDAVRRHIDEVVRTFNGVVGEARSFDRLDDLLNTQPYRLAYWRVAAEEINYRRFFDINELAAIRVEDPAVFERVHELVFSLLRRGMVDGLRIDHVDGLFDPADYLQRLQQRAREVRPDLYAAAPLYVIVEKILDRDEQLPAWPVAGTTGYDFLGMLNGLFVDARNEAALRSVYERFTRVKTPYRELVYRSKQRILRLSMASELNVLAHALNQFSERHRHYRDFTVNSLVYAMREIIACFPVYRTYVTDREPPSERDRRDIERATGEARRRNPGLPSVVFDFVRDLLLGKGDFLSPHERDEHMRLVGKFQQVTSPVTAKGIEDTAFYLYNRLVSLNEVGSEPDHFGVSPDALHDWLQLRAARWPHALSTTSTHDTKRSEDVRARLNVLSELPGAWKQATARWARVNQRGHTSLNGQLYPDRNEEYLLYQTLVGSWPLEPMNGGQEAEYRARIAAYMLKAMREAKEYTSWINPSEPHERAMAKFVAFVLAPDHAAFRADFVRFADRVARYGIYNSLAQTAVKIGAPGVPDFYQGTELWDFSLVDPDNRRPVDYAVRRSLLAHIEAQLRETGPASVARDLLSRPCDPRLKLYSTIMLLRYRRDHRDLFERGGYAPLTSEGLRRDHLFGFARAHGEQRLLVVVPRLVATLCPDPQPPLGERTWGDTWLRLDTPAPPAFRDVLTGRYLTPAADGRGPLLRAADLFTDFPIAVLEATVPRVG